MTPMTMVLFLHLVWPVVRVDDAWHSQLLSSLLVSGSPQLDFPLLQEEVSGVVSGEFLGEGRKV